MRIDRARFHALALAMAGCGAATVPAAAPVAVPEKTAEPAPDPDGVVCAKTRDDGACARWEPTRPPEMICVLFLPGAACAEAESRRVAPVETEDGYRYLEPASECLEWADYDLGPCIRSQARYPVTVQTCADWSDADQECRAWEATDPAPAEERSPF